MKDSIIEDFVSVAHNVLPKGSQVWLYGSRARGDFHEDSDWDILILIDKPNISSADEDAYSYPFVLIGWQHAVSVNPLLYTFEEWQQRKASPFFINVERDKISIS